MPWRDPMVLVLAMAVVNLANHCSLTFHGSDILVLGVLGGLGGLLLWGV